MMWLNESSYSELPVNAFAKIVGLLVTPVTPSS